MGRLRKIALNKTVVFITTSVEEGFMFPPNALIREIIIGALAKAQALYPLKICQGVVESTHVHLEAVVDDPNYVRGFMERFKTESAHAVNRLLGRKKRTIWCEGYDSPVLFTPEDVVDKIAYIYENPSKDGLEDRIELYPGVSWFRYRAQESAVLEAPLVPRSGFEKLPLGKLTESDYQALARRLGRGRKRIKFRLSPNAWMQCMGITEPKDMAEYHEKIDREIRLREEGHRAERVRTGRGVIGWRRLVATQIGQPYQPDRCGMRTWCICADKEKRREFISWAKGLVVKGREVLERWRMGDRSVPYPLGLYPPSMPKTAELIFC